MTAEPELVSIDELSVTELERLPKRRDTIIKTVGVLLLLGFILPVQIDSFHHFGPPVWIFPNLQYPGAGPTEVCLSFSPLFAGIAALIIAYLKISSRDKSHLLLVLGLTPIFSLSCLTSRVKADGYETTLLMMSFIALAGLLGSIRSLIHRPRNARGHLIAKVCVVIVLVTIAAIAFLIPDLTWSIIGYSPIVRDVFGEQTVTNIVLVVWAACLLMAMILCIRNGPREKNARRMARAAFQLLLAALYVPLLCGFVLALRGRADTTGTVISGSFQTVRGGTHTVGAIVSFIKAVGWFGGIGFLLPFGISEVLIFSRPGTSFFGFRSGN